MVCYLGNTFCYAIQGEMKNESKPNHRSRGMITHADHPQSHLDLRSSSHPRSGVNRTYQELLKVIIFFVNPRHQRSALVYSHLFQATVQHTAPGANVSKLKPRTFYASLSPAVAGPPGGAAPRQFLRDHTFCVRDHTVCDHIQGEMKNEAIARAPNQSPRPAAIENPKSKIENDPNPSEPNRTQKNGIRPPATRLNR